MKAKKVDSNQTGLIRYAKYKCNKCNKIFMRNLGWKAWTPSFCESTGLHARLYRISAPIYNKYGK